MATVTDYLDPKDLSHLANHQVLAKRVVEGFCSGLHRSPHKGFSVEFKQHRQYVPGDEIRRLDWKVYGKTDRFYIREYEEETNLRCNILLDASGSMAYEGTRTEGRSKLHYASRLAACLSYMILKQTDSVGLITFDTKVRKVLPARGRAAHVSNVIDILAETTAGGETDLGNVFHELVPKLKRRGLVVIISDCFGDLDSVMKGLAHFRHAKHDVVIFQIWDPDELDFPFKQWTRFDCLEVADRKHTVDPTHLRQAYLENLENYRQNFKQGCHRNRIDLVPMTTDQPYAEALAYYLALRKRGGKPARK
jgi:uncharacterized protein (DUF58 family)